MKKEFKSWIILDWKYGNMRLLRKTIQSSEARVKKKLKPSEILVDFNIIVKIPENPAIKAHGEIELPEAKVKEILIDSFDNDDEN